MAHSRLATSLWNSMLTPPGSRRRGNTFSDPPLCPAELDAFFPGVPPDPEVGGGATVVRMDPTGEVAGDTK
jgi:hypothetical protein